MRCYRKILHISYKDCVTNEEVCAKIQQAIKPDEDLLTIIKRHKLQWYGHVSCSSGLPKTIFQGTVKGGRTQGRQKKKLQDSIREWTGLELLVVPQQPAWLRDRWRWRKGRGERGGSVHLYILDVIFIYLHPWGGVYACMLVCVCVCVCVHVCTHTCTQACGHACICTLIIFALLYRNHLQKCYTH